MKMTSNANGESIVSETKLTQDNMESMRSSSGVGGDARARRLGKLDPTHSVTFVCDIQEKFAPSITHFDTIVNNTERLLKVSNMLGIPTIATEQYPKGLGSTVEPLKSMLNEQPFSKTQFTMLVGDVENRLEILRRQRPVDTIILVGIETHVCIIATCIDLIHRGFNVHVVADASSSRTQTDRHLALDRMRTIGAHITTTESVILSLVGDASHANFKEIQRIIRNVLPDTGLIPSNANQSDNVNEIINGNGSTNKMQASL